MQCPTPLSLPDPNGTHNSQRITVPCGRCGACRNNRRSDWSFRLTQELKTARNAWFLTLTYSDETIPTTQDGEITLRKKDLQDFKKRLRKENANHWNQTIRYYSVGEYGTETDRPHYHSIMFNAHLNAIGQLDSVWPFGHHYVGQVSPASIHYVSKFHINVQSEDETRQPEFATMSRRPGIGANYLERNKNWHQENEYFHVINNGYKQRLPRYYAQKLFSDQQRRIHAERVVQQADESYWNEYERLDHLQILDPDRYMWLASLNEAKKVKNKASEGNTF